MNVYMHTLNGKPAFFDRVDRVVYYAKPTMVAHDLFVTDLNQIKQQQSMSKGNRNDVDTHVHGYILIRNVDAYVMGHGVRNA